MSEAYYSLDRNQCLVFCHMRKTAGTPIVRALENSSCKLPRYHRNGQAWSGPRSDAAARIHRIWQLDRGAWDVYTDERVREDRGTVVIEWNAPPFLLEIARDPAYEVFTCLRDPYSRFCSEFFSRETFHVRYEGGGAANEESGDPGEWPAVDRLVQENRVGMPATKWIEQTLYWKRDGGEPFKVAINRHNYLAPWFCGLFDQPDFELGEEHLEKARSIVASLQGVMILGSPESYSLLWRYNFAGRLERTNVNSRPRDDSLIDLSRDEYNDANATDCQLLDFARQLTEQRLRREASATLAAQVHSRRRPEEDAIMRDIDMVVALKERGLLVRAVLEALSRLYAPRRAEERFESRQNLGKRKRRRRCNSPSLRRLLKIKGRLVAGGRLELPTLGL